MEAVCLSNCRARCQPESNKGLGPHEQAVLGDSLRRRRGSQVPQSALICWFAFHHFAPSSLEMRFRRTTVALLLLCLSSAVAHAAGMQTKQRVIVLAVDSSGSMARTDPHRRRIDAAELLLAAASNSDDVGLISFGDRPEWISNTVVSRRDFDFRKAEALGQSSQHTDFAALLETWNAFLNSQPDGFFDTHDVQLVVLTDGQPDAVGQSSEDNANQALLLAQKASNHSSINAIALGPDAKSSLFLEQLVHAGHGRSAYANTDSDLTNAFLQVATYVLSLPAYQRFSQSGPLEDFGPAKRSLLVILGSTSGSEFGRPLLNTPSVQLYDVGQLKPGEQIRVQGATAFYCREADIQLKPSAEVPSGWLVDQSPQVTFRVFNGPRQIENAFFLQRSELEVMAVGSRSEYRTSFPASSSGFTASLRIPEPGRYELHARLNALYGSIEQPLGEHTVSATAVNVPEQITVARYPGVAGWFLRSKLVLRLVVPYGSAQIRFQAPQGVTTSSASSLVTPDSTSNLRIWVGASAHDGAVIDVPYTVDWNDGDSHDTRQAVLRLAVRRATPSELLKGLSLWFALAAAILTAAWLIVDRFRSRAIRGRLVIARGSAIIISMHLPEEFRTTVLEIHMTTMLDAPRRSGSTIEIPGRSNERLITFRALRGTRRPEIQVSPGHIHIEAGARKINAATRLSAIPRSRMQLPDEDLTISLK